MWQLLKECADLPSESGLGTATVDWTVCFLFCIYKKLTAISYSASAIADVHVQRLHTVNNSLTLQLQVTCIWLASSTQQFDVIE